MAGFWRAIYYLIGSDYIGTVEQKKIDRQKHLKYMTCKQIDSGNIPVLKSKLSSFINEPFVKSKKKWRCKKGDVVARF
jgi:hypothetical protein